MSVIKTYHTKVVCEPGNTGTVQTHCQQAPRKKQITSRKFLLASIQQLEQHSNAIFADLHGYKSPAKIFNRFKPDIILKKGQNGTIVDLICCFETNLLKSHQYKVNKYVNLENHCEKNLKVT